MRNNLNFLSTRNGFNIALRHFKLVNTIIKSFERKENLADLLNNALENKQLEQYQFISILNALLIDKYKYYAKSFNIKKSYEGDLTKLAKEFSEWNRFDLVFCYNHPQLGEILINPKKESSWESFDMLKENELLVVYIGYFNNLFDIEIAKKAFMAIKSIINGEKISNTKIFKEEGEVITPVTKKEEKVVTKEIKKEEKPLVNQQIQTTQQNNKPTQIVSTTTPVKKKLSPKYGILVSNELFHNGNVEAWKRIITSYENKYPDTKVLVFYEGEQIHDINTLFKWGKVKHGTNIYISLLGPDFRDVSKLRRYLAQGASPRFEDFLRGDPTKMLQLF